MTRDRIRGGYVVRADIMTAAEKRIALANLDKRYAWIARKSAKRSNPARLIPLVRINEIERLCIHRYGGQCLPDDDDGRDTVELVAHHIAFLGGEIENHILSWARMWAP